MEDVYRTLGSDRFKKHVMGIGILNLFYALIRTGEADNDVLYETMERLFPGVTKDMENATEYVQKRQDLPGVNNDTHIDDESGGEYV